MLLKITNVTSFTQNPIDTYDSLYKLFLKIYILYVIFSNKAGLDTTNKQPNLWTALGKS